MINLVLPGCVSGKKSHNFSKSVKDSGLTAEIYSVIVSWGFVEMNSESN